jgi:hypothetical protein
LNKKKKKMIELCRRRVSNPNTCLFQSKESSAPTTSAFPHPFSRQARLN